MKRILSIVLFPMLLLSGCGQNRQTSEAETVPEVKVLKIGRSVAKVPITAPAQLHGRQDINIFPQVTGILEKVYVVEGEAVKKGQKLFSINSTSSRAAVDNASAAVQMAKARVETQRLELSATEQLYNKGIVSEHQYKVHQNALMIEQSNLAEAEAVLAHARNELSHTLICAPSNGVVGSINYRQGSLVGPTVSSPLTVVSDNSTVYAYVSVNSNDYMEMLNMAGGREKLIESLPEAELLLGNGITYGEKGHVETVSGVIDPQTGSISVRIAFPNPNGLLSSGGAGSTRMSWEYEGIVIPRKAAYELQEKNFVYKCVSDGNGGYNAVSTEVKVYRLNDSEYLVDEGLSEGDVIVSEGVRKLSNGMKVTPVNE